MKFNKIIEVNFPNGGQILLRRPSAEEYNDFKSSAYPARRKGIVVNDSSLARIRLFDVLFIKQTGIEDDEGPLPEDGKDRLPVEWKDDIVFRAIEQPTEIDIKN